jgi:hypothetical protein
MARLYDKVIEIETKSKKTWMYGIWKMEGPPKNGRVIRVEFQLRREVLRQLAIDTVWQLFKPPWPAVEKNRKELGLPLQRRIPSGSTAA